LYRAVPLKTAATSFPCSDDAYARQLPAEHPDHDVVHVRFFDSENGQCFGERDLPVERLPESFEADTTLHLGDEDWSVVEARPMTAAEFRRAGELVLILRKVKIGTIDPNEVLFTLSTICDALPPIAEGSSKLGKQVLEIHEDDWRQVEWITDSQSDLIETELTAIRRIYETEREGIGFRNLHVRQAVTTPLRGDTIRLDELRSLLGDCTAWLDGVSFRGVAGVVQDSFAARLLSSIDIFGIAREGVVESFCFHCPRTNNAPQPDVRKLAEFARSRALLLVDWCRATVVAPLESEYVTYFASE
jgi:hypothetical protein